MADEDGPPSRNKPPALLKSLPTDMQLNWIDQQAKTILADSVLNSNDLQAVHDTIQSRDETQRTIESFKLNDVYQCPCGKRYTRRGNFIKHGKECDSVRNQLLEDGPSENFQKTDDLFNQASVFMKLALLHRDLYDAYRYGDGARVMTDVKLALLYFHKCGHTKYALWVWRMLAFSKAILSPRHGHEYIWNISSNTEGGLGKNIPNDNLVEMHVKAIKNMLKKQGANITFQSAQEAALLVQVFKEIGDNFDAETSFHKKSKAVTKVERTSDIKLMMNELISADAMSVVHGRTAAGFGDFRDPILNIDMSKLADWMSGHKHKMSRDFGDLYG